MKGDGASPYARLKRISLYAFQIPPHEEESEDPIVEETMVVIACHNSAAGIQNTLRSLLQIFPARNIFIADNNGALTPTDDTEAKVSP